MSRDDVPGDHEADLSARPRARPHGPTRRRVGRRRRRSARRLGRPAAEPAVAPSPVLYDGSAVARRGRPDRATIRPSAAAARAAGLSPSSLASPSPAPSRPRGRRRGHRAWCHRPTRPGRLVRRSGRPCSDDPMPSAAGRARLPGWRRGPPIRPRGSRSTSSGRHVRRDPRGAMPVRRPAGLEDRGTMPPT